MKQIMKQIIKRNYNGNISIKHYENNRGELHGLHIGYLYNGKVKNKTNYVNGKKYGIDTWWNLGSKIEIQRYYL